MYARWQRSDGDSGEFLSVVRLDSGTLFYCAALDAELPFLVQVTTGPEAGDYFRTPGGAGANRGRVGSRSVSGEKHDG
jgi:hypothetical protein